LNVFGAYVYNAGAGDTEVYSVVANSSYAYQSSAALATGVPTALNETFMNLGWRLSI
jgi:hypothetical protein